MSLHCIIRLRSGSGRDDLRLGVMAQFSVGTQRGNRDEQDSDVVVAPVAVGGRHEGLAGFAEGGLGGRGWDGSEDVFDLAVDDVVGEAVGGEQIEIVRLEVMAPDLGLDARPGADGTGDEVAHGRAGGLGGGNLTGAELFFDKGMIVGELLQMASAEAVTAAVAYVGEPEGGGCCVSVGNGGEQRDQRGAHSGKFEGLAGLLVDSLIGGMDGAAKAGLRFGGVVAIGGGRGEEVKEGFGGKAAGDLTRCGSAHAIANDEGSGLGSGGAGVLVALADEARVRQHRVDELVWQHRWSEKSSAEKDTR
jgi:hypothetical protein